MTQPAALLALAHRHARLHEPLLLPIDHPVRLLPLLCLHAHLLPGAPRRHRNPPAALPFGWRADQGRAGRRGGTPRPAPLWLLALALARAVSWRLHSLSGACGCAGRRRRLGAAEGRVCRPCLRQRGVVAAGGRFERAGAPRGPRAGRLPAGVVAVCWHAGGRGGLTGGAAARRGRRWCRAAARRCSAGGRRRARGAPLCAALCVGAVRGGQGAEE